MHPLTKGACATAIIAAFGAPSSNLAPLGDDSAPAVDTGAIDVASDERRAACPKRSLPLDPAGRACAPLPDATQRPLSARARRLAAAPNADAFLRTRTPSELIPRLPDRPEKFADYLLPVEPVHAVATPAEPEIDSEPRLGVDIETDGGAPVSLIELEGQTGKPQVVLVGQLHGITVIVRHAVESKAGPREYLVLYGNLSRPGPGIVNGAPLSRAAVIGYVGEKDDEGGAALYVEVRLERGKLDRPTEHLSQLVSSGISVAVDPRNVFPLKR